MKQINTMRAMLSLLVVAITCLTAKGQLNGTYTVYGAGANYADLAAAANALSAGVSGPVTFKIRQGTWSHNYTSDALIGNIAGASATNTITFEAENGNAATTIIENTNIYSSVDSNYIFYFNSAKYIRVRNLTLNKTDGSYGTILRFAGDADYNIVENCILVGHTGTTTSTNKARVYGTSLVNANNNIIRNNSIDRGSYGIYWSGSSTSSLSADNEFSGNTFNQPYNYGMYTYYTSNHKILNNTITRSGSGSFYGIYLRYCDNAFKIEGNTITTTSVTTSTHYPIYMYYSDASSNNRGSISGNTISVSSSTTCYGIYSYYSNYYDVANNKVTLNSSGACYTLYANNGNSSSYGKSTYITGNEFTSTSNSSHYVYNYGYYLDDTRFNNNKITFNGGTGIQEVYAGYHYTYGGRQFNGNTIKMYGSSCSQNIYVAYQYTYGGLEMTGNDIEMAGTSSGSKFIYAGYYYIYDGFKFDNNKIKMNGTTGSKYIYAGYQYPEDGLSFSGNEIDINTTSGAVNIYGTYWSYYNTDPVKLNNNKITVIATSSASIYNYLGYYNYNSTASGNECKGNKVTLKTNGSYAMNYMGYYFDGMDLSDNEVEVRSTYYAYGMYSQGISGRTNPWKIRNNKVTSVSTGYLAYGLVNNDGPSADVGNNVVYAKGGNYTYGLMVSYSTGSGANIYNNTVYTEGGSSANYTFYAYNYTSGQFANIRNNVFSRSGGGGYLCYLGHPNYFSIDYNNFHNNGATMCYYGNIGQTYASIQAWRAGTNSNHNSFSYNPGFISTSSSSPDLRPDPANPNSWSLNGRGVQIASNDKDIMGNARALTTVQGVPDIGAYEFVPTSTPPNCTVNPAPAPAGTSYVDFGGDTVAVLHWGGTVPTGFAVKQYTGTNPPGITSINPTQMFYYADFQGTGTSLDYEQDLYYKDPWMGTIASKSALRLAEKVGSGSWTGYAPATSSSNVVRNFIHTPSVNDVGALFTGIDVSNNAAADAIIEPVSPFCPGTYTVKLRIKNAGNNVINNVKIDWQKDGGAIQTINHTTPININGSPQGNEAIITLGNITFGSAPVQIKAWTYLPNGVVDPIPGDDMIDVTMFAALSGTYTVGGINPHFPNVIAAAEALTKYGTCGDVVFDIRPGTYTGKVTINNPLYVNNPNKVTFQAENGNASSVTITYSTTTYNDPVLTLNAADYITLKKLTVEAPSGTYGQCIAMKGDSDEDSIIGCRVINNSTLMTTYNAGIFAYPTYTNYSGDNLVIKDNTINGGYASVLIYNQSYTDDLVIDNNTVTAGGPYCLYLLYMNRMKVTNNILTGSNSYNTNYGIMAQYAYQSPEIINNKISNLYYSGIYLYQPAGISNTNRGRVINNSVITKNSTTSYYPFMYYYGSNMDVLNNTIVNNGNSASYYAAYILLSSYSNNTFYNNVFANLAGGPVYQMSYASGYNNLFDYNNLYTTSTSKFADGSPSASSFAGWRSAINQDKNSVTYDPAITSSTDPRPDVYNPAVWALNGHGLHLAGNDKDIDGNPRVETRPDGVPDIGAYEVVPEVMPPLATAVPATADKGDTQIFSFAGNEVGRIKWGMTAPVVPVEVRQYSGEKGLGIAAAASPSGSMYFHTDVKPLGNGTTYDFDLNIDYMDIWLGDIATEGNLRLAHLVTGYPWMVYSGSLSSINATTNQLDASGLNRFGSFSALENNSVISAFVRAQGSVIICTGNSVQLNAEPQDGDNYKWYRNGTAIPGADGPNMKSYIANQAGDYSVEITFTGKSVESVPLTVSTIAPPNALIAANRPLTYCVGNGLTLDAGTGLGLKYQWQLNGNDIPGATNNTYPVNQPGNYTVVVTNVGCSSVSSASAVTSGPISVDLGNDTSYCEVPNVWATLDAGYPGARYTWSTGDTSRIIEVKQGGKYWVEVDGGPNCTGTDTIEVTIDQLPSANGISFVQNGNSYQFYPSGPIGAKGFLWLFSDGTTSNQANPTKTITGDVYVRLVLFNQCGTDTVQLGWPLSVQEIADENSVSVYPNPAKDKVTVTATGTELKEVEVLNSVGSVVYRGAVNGGNSHGIDVSGLANGHYMLRATTTGGVISRQFDVLK